MLGTLDHGQSLQRESTHFQIAIRKALLTGEPQERENTGKWFPLPHTPRLRRLGRTRSHLQEGEAGIGRQVGELQVALHHLTALVEVAEHVQVGLGTGREPQLHVRAGTH